MKKYMSVFLLASLLLLSGCGEDEGSEDEGGTVDSASQGWHYPGRDCLACHNSDLGESKHLLVAGTVYRDQNVVNQDDIANVCGGELIINFLDSNSNVVYSSNDYKDSNSKGYKGKGNIFILQRTLRLLTAGTYRAQITDTSGTQMAISGLSHSFTSQDYDINNPTDSGNRLSCNACHIKGGSQAPLYIQDATLCK